jgi:acyl-CoA dehydrogenase
VRDGRINQTYEGANGVQAMDLVGRKLGRKGGAAPMALFGLIGGWISDNEKDDKLVGVVKPIKRGLDTLQQATMWLAQHGMQNPNDAGAGAYDYLRMMGIVVTGWMWARMAKLSQEKLAAGATNKNFYEQKLVSARYWMERLMPECPMLFERIQMGSEALMAYVPETA